MSHRIWFVLMCGLGLTLALPAALADEPTEPAPLNHFDVHGKPDKPKPTPRQRQVLLVGVYLLAAVACVGALLLLWIVWWGSRLRAFNRRPLPAARAQDPFWFLKQPVEKPPPADGDAPAREGEGADPP